MMRTYRQRVLDIEISVICGSECIIYCKEIQTVTCFVTRKVNAFGTYRKSSQLRDKTLNKHAHVHGSVRSPDHSRGFPGPSLTIRREDLIF